MLLQLESQRRRRAADGGQQRRIFDEADSRGRLPRFRNQLVRSALLGRPLTGSSRLCALARVDRVGNGGDQKFVDLAERQRTECRLDADRREAACAVRAEHGLHPLAIGFGVLLPSDSIVASTICRSGA